MITFRVSPAGDDTVSSGGDADCRQADRLNEIVERQVRGQLEYGDVEIVAGQCERLVDNDGGDVRRLARLVYLYLHAAHSTPRTHSIKTS